DPQRRPAAAAVARPAAAEPRPGLAARRAGERTRYRRGGAAGRDRGRPPGAGRRGDCRDPRAAAVPGRPAPRPRPRGGRVLKPALALFRRDLLLAWRQRGGAVPVLGAFVL